MKKYARYIVDNTINLNQAIKALRREVIQKTLQETRGNKTYAAQLLGINRVTLLAEIQKYVKEGLLIEVEAQSKSYRQPMEK